MGSEMCIRDSDSNGRNYGPLGEYSINLSLVALQRYKPASPPQMVKLGKLGKPKSTGKPGSRNGQLKSFEKVRIDSILNKSVEIK